MDFACNLQQSNILGGNRCGRYRVVDAGNVKLRFRMGGIGDRHLGTANLVPKSCAVKNVRRNCAFFSSNLCFGREIDSLWTLQSVKSVASVPRIRAKMPRPLLPAHCQGNDSVVYLDESDRSMNPHEDMEKEVTEEGSSEFESSGSGGQGGNETKEVPDLDDLRELLQKARRDLEVAHLNSNMFEEKAQKISEIAIAMKDEAISARNDVVATVGMIEEAVNDEVVAKEIFQKATMALSLAEARLQVALEALEEAKLRYVPPTNLEGSDLESEMDEAQASNILKQEEAALLLAQEEIKGCKATLENSEAELVRLQSRKEELQKEVDRLNEVAEQAQINALKADEDVANIMLLAEQAVAFELEAAQRVNDAEIALQREEKALATSMVEASDIPIQQNLAPSLDKEVVDDEVETQLDSSGNVVEIEKDLMIEKPISDSYNELSSQGLDKSNLSDNEKVGIDSAKDIDVEVENLKSSVQAKKQEVQKDTARDSSTVSAPKASLKKSSRFFPASFFSYDAEEAEFTPASMFYNLISFAKKQMPKLIVVLLLLGAGVTYYTNRTSKGPQLLQQPNVITTTMEEVSLNAMPIIQQLEKIPKELMNLIEKLPHQEINEEEASLFDVLWLLLASVIFVPIFQKIPGGSPVLGYLAAGILIGPYGLSIIRHVHGTKAIAEFGVVFLLFNIGLELSVERLSSMKKYVFGLGSAQVLVTAAVVGLIAHFISGQLGPAAIVIGNGLALSSTAVVLQVLQERGESTSRHGRATFSVLLFQDLAVVVLLILIPLISPNSSKGGVGFQAIAEALGLAALKAIVAIAAIIAGGRLLLRPIYRQIAENQNAEIFSANTLLVILGTSLLTARAGLSMALGAFLAGLLLAETEFSLQVESDIAPYRGLLLGLFFMTVGMSIDPKLLLSNFPVIAGALGLLIVGKTLLVALVGKVFGLSLISGIRSGLLLAPGGEFAFVAFGEAVNQGIMSPQLSSLLFLVVGISMAVTPWLAAGGQLIASRFEQHDVRSLLPVESETDDLQDHIIICGFGRVGQIIAQLLSERLIPFVALDVRSDRVAIGRSLDLPVYFGDAGSREVLHKIGAERACAAAITLDTPGANYRTVWALSKYFPNVKTFVRAHDVDHGLNLEKAGATAVVPETLEPSLQLAAAVLAQAKLPMSEIASTINEFRSRHLSELSELCEASGSSLGYGYSRVMNKPKSQSPDSSDDNQPGEGLLAI
ncbi:hypothetical protein V2J09_005189 [Rumex salicifolius]